MKKIALFMALVLIVVMISACGGEKATELEITENQEYYTKLADKDITINVYNWGEYIPDGTEGTVPVNDEFTKLTGIKINYSTYATNEELYAKLKGGAANYDVIIPSDYMISRMIEEDMLEKIDFSNIPSYKNIMEKFKTPEYDPTAEYSVAYTWGTVGIIYNKDKVDIPEEDIDLDVLWNEKYKGNILMFDNPRDAFALAQSLLGISLNTTNEAELKAAADKLKEQKPLVQAYVMDEIFDKMGSGEAIFAPYYAGDALALMEDYDNLGFAVPKGKTNLFVDAMCIPKNSKNKEAAEMYISYICEPVVSKAILDYLEYSTPNEVVYDMLDDDVKNNGISYPSDEYLKEHTEVFKNLSPKANLYMQNLWTEIKSES